MKKQVVDLLLFNKGAEFVSTVKEELNKKAAIEYEFSKFEVGSKMFSESKEESDAAKAHVQG